MKQEGVTFITGPAGRVAESAQEACPQRNGLYRVTHHKCSCTFGMSQNQDPPQPDFM